MQAKTIYQSADGRVLLLRRGRVFSVEVAGGEYGPFSWAEALSWYNRHRAPACIRYDITVTDTYGGELNYSWADRHKIKAPADIRTSTLVRRAKAVAGLTGRHTTEDYGDSIIVRMRGACIAMTIEARP